MLFNLKRKTIFALSDTHGMHRSVSVPKGVDLIIHCGDACNDGNEEQLHLFGHIHSNGGKQTEIRGVKFCNVAWI